MKNRGHKRGVTNCLNENGLNERCSPSLIVREIKNSNCT